MYVMRSVGVGGWRGWLGVVMIALILGLAYASLASTVLGQWRPEAATPGGVIVLTLAAYVAILIWLLGALLR